MSFVPLTETEVESGEPVKTTTMNKIKENFDDHEARLQVAETSSGVFPPIILRVNGRYSQLGAADDILRTTINFDINITGVRILIDKAGSAGDTEIDIKYKRGDGPWTSIFSVPPVANYADGDDFLSDSGTLDGTQGELKAGDIIRLDQLSVQTDGVGYLVRIDWNRTFTGGE